MRFTRWLTIGTAMAALGGAASACGGATSGGSARTDLEENGHARCAEACETVAQCDLGGDSCACGCSSGDPGGCDTVCECEPPTVAECTAGCSEQVAEILSDAPGCEDEMLALIRCVRGATCGEDTCEAAQERVESCAEAGDEPDDKPVAASPT